MKNPKLCILFLYHKCDDLTRNHLNSLTLSNPDAVIIPLTNAVTEHLPNTVDVASFQSRWPTSNHWRNIDTTIYNWFLNRTIDAEKYLFIEYDCFCNVNLIDYYKEVWDSDVAGVDFFSIKKNPGWNWFRENELDKLTDTERPHASGIAPFVCTLFSHNALEQTITNTNNADIFCELRLGTTVRKLNLKFKRLPLLKRSTISWHPYPWQINRPGLFHGIKSCDHNSGREPQPGLLKTIYYDIRRSFSSWRILKEKGI